eukprot:scaffold17438_cov48-Phaeocystis_antarctica.AAC.2
MHHSEAQVFRELRRRPLGQAGHGVPRELLEGPRAGRRRPGRNPGLRVVVAELAGQFRAKHHAALSGRLHRCDLAAVGVQRVRSRASQGRVIVGRVALRVPILEHRAVGIEANVAQDRHWGLADGVAPACKCC